MAAAKKYSLEQIVAKLRDLLSLAPEVRCVEGGRGPEAQGSGARDSRRTRPIVIGAAGHDTQTSGDGEQ